MMKLSRAGGRWRVGVHTRRHCTCTARLIGSRPVLALVQLHLAGIRNVLVRAASLRT